MTAALEGGEWSATRPGRTLPPRKDPVPILQQVGWAPGPVWTGGKSRPHRNSISDRRAHSQSLYRLSYPAHFISCTFYIFVISPDDGRYVGRRMSRVWEINECQNIYSVVLVWQLSWTFNKNNLMTLLKVSPSTSWVFRSSQNTNTTHSSYFNSASTGYWKLRQLICILRY